MRTCSDVVIVGGGIVGLATALELRALEPTLSISVLEKEASLARHQSGRNSGVLHAGVYYRPGSLKALLCRTGKVRLEEFCRAEAVAFRISGKLILASTEDELPRLDALEERARANGVRVERLSEGEIGKLEPHARGVAALHVPETGVVDFAEVCRAYAARLQRSGGTRVVLGVAVHGGAATERGVTLDTSDGAVSAGAVVNCAGLQSDRVARAFGVHSDVRIVPFRGCYHRLADDAAHLVRTLIYPVPEPAFPFLGVHFTRHVDGSVGCGPNAVLALGREAYQAWQLNPGDLVEALAFRGLRRLARRHFGVGLGEAHRALDRGAFARALQRLVPSVEPEMLLPAPAGIRAQAVRSDGSLVDDFVIENGPRMVHVLNAPSPAATASLAIGRTIAEQVLERFSSSS